MTTQSHPYRSPGIQAQQPQTVDIETNDVSIDVHYLDTDGSLRVYQHEFKGNPSAKFHSDGVEFYPIKHTGSGLYTEWRCMMGERQLVVFDDLVFPTHRLLKINVKKKTRIARVVIEK